MIETKSRRSLSQIAYLWLSALGGAAFAFATQVLLARTVSPAEYGSINAALLVYTVLAPMAGMGIAGFWLRTFGALGSKASVFLGPSLRLAAVGTFLSTCLALLWALLGPHSGSIALLYVALLPTLWSAVAVDLIISIRQIQQRYIHVSFWQTLTNTLRFAVLALAVVTIPSFDVRTVQIVIVATSAAVFIAAGISIASFKRTVAESDLAAPSIQCVFSSAWPFGVLPFMHFIYFQGGIFVVFYMIGEEAAAYYFAAFTIVSATYILPAAIFQRFLLPKYHNWHGKNDEMLLKTYRFGNFSMIMLGFGTLAGLFLLGPFIIALTYGIQYQAAVAVLAVLTLAIPLRYLASSVGAVLLTARNVQRKIVYMAITAVASVVLTVQFVMWFGMLGAAWAAVVSEALLVILFLHGARRHVFGSEALRGWFDINAHLRILRG